MRSLRFTRPGLDGVTLNAQLRGGADSPCVVLLHGGGANLHWWDEIAPRLARGFRVVALDFRGHGDSDYPAQRRPGAFQRDLDALLEELAVPEVALVGHSMGGHLALDHAARHPSVWGLVAVEVSFGSPPRERRRTRLALQLRRVYASRDEALQRFRLLPHTPGVSETRRRQLAEHSVRALPDGGFAYKFDPGWFGLPPAPRTRLGDVACPTLVIRGADSPLLSQQAAERVVDELPRGELLVLEGGGHNVHLEQPARVADAIAAHLGRARAAVD